MAVILVLGFAKLDFNPIGLAVFRRENIGAHADLHPGGRGGVAVPGGFNLMDDARRAFLNFNSLFPSGFLFGVCVNLEEIIELRENDAVLFHLVARAGIVSGVVVRHFVAVEILDRAHDVLVKDVADAELKAAPSVVSGIINRSDGGVMTEMAIRDERAPGAFVLRVGLLVVKLDAP